MLRSCYGDVKKCALVSGLAGIECHTLISTVLLIPPSDIGSMPSSPMLDLDEPALIMSS